MTKTELAQYAGTRFFNLSQRMGAVRGTIYCLTVYEVTERGTCRYSHEVLSCIANKAQYSALELVTGGNYHIGRPCASNLKREFLDASK